MADLDKLRKQREQIDAKIKQEIQKQNKAERKGRNHAMMVLGGMLAKRFSKDWKSIDFEKLDALLEDNADKFASCTCEDLPLAEAKKRLRNWEKGNAWDSYGKDPETAEAMTAEIYGEVVAEGKQGLEDNFGYPQAPAKSVAPSSPAASSTPQNQAQSADALGVDSGAFSPFVE